MRIIPILFILLAVLFVLLQKADIRIRKTDNLSITLSLTLFSITFSGDTERKRRIKKIFRLFKNAPIILRVATHLLKRSNVRVIRLANQNRSPFPFSFGQSIPFYISFPVLFAYLNNNAKSIFYDDNWLFTGDFSNQNEASVDIIVSFRFISLIISALLFLYYKMKDRIMRGIKDV